MQLRDQFPILGVHPHQSCPRSLLTEVAGRSPNPHRTATPTSYLERGHRTPERTEAAAPLAIPRQAGRRKCPRFHRSCLFPESREEAALLANPHRPPRPAAQLRQDGRQPGRTEEGVLRLAPPQAMHSVPNLTVYLQPGCRRSARMEEAPRLAIPPYLAPSPSDLLKLPPTRAQEQPRKLAAAPSGGPQLGQRLY